MRMTKKRALNLWAKHFGNARYAVDFHGSLMCREAYGDEMYYIVDHGEKVFCGWDIHHILPSAQGGTDSEANLLCTNITTNRCAGDRITFWIDDSQYQIRHICGTGGHEIIKLT